MNQFITLVSGLPRSGTSLMMQMLAAGGMPLLTDAVRDPDDQNPRGYFEFEPVRRTLQDASWVTSARGKAVKVIYPLLRDLPSRFEYRVILMEREIREVVASQRLMLECSGRSGAGLADDRMAAVFTAELLDIRVWLSRQSNFSVLGVDHRDCREHPVIVAARLNLFLGSSLNEAPMAAVFDHRLHRHRV